MAVKLTDEQKAAVYAPVGENLVSAAAGSGKTKVLSERIVSRIKSGDTTIDRLLIVTFTRAAAAQMRERIALALEEEYKKEQLHSLKRQLSMIAGADICTIDSFCINLVRKNFFKVDVPPDFVIADSNEMKILREEVLLEVLEEMYAENDENFMLLADTIGSGKNDNELKDMITKAYFFTRAFEEPDEWLEGALESHREGSEENNHLFDLIADEIKDRLKELGEILHNNAREAENVGLESYIKVMEDERERFDRYLKDCSVDNLSDSLEKFCMGSFSGGRKKGEEGFENEKKYLQNIHNDAKELHKNILSLYDVYSDKRGISYPKMEALVKCVEKFDRLYMEEKKSRKMLEFSDCEYLALKILNSSEEICDELRDKYDEIYIDEYQDTNPLQDALFAKISRKSRGEANIFIVGDVKQSIYRFRHSDPRVFAQKAKTFGKTEDSCKMVLSKNFRSREAVIDSVNCVFERIMREGTAQVEYDDEHRLKCGADYYIQYNQNKSELHILKEKYDSDDEDEILAVEQRETLVAAHRIRRLIDEGFMVMGKDGMRPVKYSDIAVLSPKINNKAEAIMKIFALMGIPAYCESKQNFFASTEIQTVVSLMRAVDNPLCDIPLASVMRSPIFAFSENELVKIRTTGREKPFYDNVVETSRERSKLGRKCRMLIDSLDEWRQTANVISLERFVTRLVDESGYYSFVGALPGGSVRQANLRRFITMAASYEKNQYKGLYNFVRYIDKTIENGGEIEADITQSDESVLVASIHKSKGLEFPVVIVIGCGWRFNDRDSSATLVMTPECGMAIVEKEKDRRVKFKTAEYNAVSMMITRENHAEQMRLLYVAMTRAKEKLIMIGSASKYEEQAASWEMYASGKKMSDYKIRSMKNYLEYICNSIDDKYWDVTIVDELPKIDEEGEDVQTTEREHKIVEEVIYRLSYTYPYDGIRNIPSKMSVSDIKKMSIDTEESAHFYKSSATEKRIPSFLHKNEKLSGSEKGTAYHRVMELIDLNETDVKKAVEKFVEKGFMTALQAECIDVDKIEKFLKSPVAERMRRAKRLWREESFTIAIDASDIFEEGEAEEICVQGTIDCLFEEENGNIVLLDYKTDRYTDPEEVGKRYKKQLELYEVAVFRRFGQNCSEKCLYLFQKGDIINV